MRKRVCEAERKLKSGNAKSEPRVHHRSRYYQSSLALFATDILELKLA